MKNMILSLGLVLAALTVGPQAMAREAGPAWGLPNRSRFRGL